MRMLLVLLVCSGNFSVFAEEHIVQQNHSVKAILPFEVPKEAVRSLRTYLDLFIAIRPIPADYLLESYTIDETNGAIELSGRFMKQGARTLFLGNFAWGQSLFPLPVVHMTVAPSEEKELSADDMLLPFPEETMRETKSNIFMRNELFEEGLMSGKRDLLARRYFRESLFGFFLLLVASPLVLFVIGQKISALKVPEEKLSLKEELDIVRKSKDWTKLLALLQRISERKESLTSYELAAYFLDQNKKSLSQAALLVEKYGYLQHPVPQQFLEAVRHVEEIIH